MPRFRFQCHNDISGFCIRRIPLCNLLSCTSAVKLSCVSHRKSVLWLSCMTGKQRGKSVFLPDNNSHVTYLPTEPSRNKARSASTRLLAQAP